MKIVASKQVYESRVFIVTEDRAVDPKTGFEIQRSVVRHRGSAVMMAVDSRRRVLLIRQYRLPAEKEMWELPAGSIDPGETALQTAKRELVEETGYRARKWTRLAAYYPSPGFVQELMTVYLATGLTAGAARPMGDERIECRWFTTAELDRMIRTRKLADGKTLVGYLCWRQFGPRS
jgi:ADP-ribose pyrophosphatase